MNITETILYLTNDIDNIANKTWLRAALISHVSSLTAKPRKLIAVAVDTFFSNPERYRSTK